MSSESAEDFGYLEQIEKGKIPQVLDIVGIDGRLAQVCTIGKNLCTVLFLDSGSVEQIHWSDYELEDQVNLALKLVVDTGKIPLPREDEIARIHFDEDSADPANSDFKLWCKYFGSFQRKK